MPLQLKEISQADFSDTKYFTKAQQQLLLIMRVNGKINGIHGQKQYKSLQFYPSIKMLCEAGWVKKNLAYNDNNRPFITYTLTNDGNEFVRMLAKFPSYHNIYDMFKTSFNIG